MLNLSSHFLPDLEAPWSSVWAHTCYYLWIWRNKETFCDDFRRPILPVSFIYSRVKLYIDAVHNYGAKAISVRSRVETDIRWIPPPASWVCLNTDGAAKGSCSVAGSSVGSVCSMRLVTAIRRLLVDGWQVEFLVFLVGKHFAFY
ncbi:hypothetical protein RIF29_40325 [Crotalaria pallida]|uniref:Uncharacterized protein n=1 Tax=Crotalaria pallida TaxID=3830 RepID=A0AAN9E2Z7_CROPI